MKIKSSILLASLLTGLAISTTAREMVEPYNVPTDSIAAMRTAIVNAPKIDDAVYYQNDMNADESDPAAFELLKYIMQCNAAYNGNLYGVYKWICEDSISARYRTLLPAGSSNDQLPDSTVRRIITDRVLAVAENYDSYTQGSMTTHACVELVVRQNELIGVCKDAISVTDDDILRKMYFNDASLWIKLFNDEYDYTVERTITFYSDFSRSMFAFGVRITSMRIEYLKQELWQIREGGVFRLNQGNYPIDWTDEETQLLKPWYNARMEAASELTDKRIADIIRAMTHLMVYAYTHNN